MALQMTNLTLTDRQTDDKNRDHTHTTTDEWHFRRRTNRDRQTDHTDHNPRMALPITNQQRETDRQTTQTDRRTTHRPQQTDGPHTYHNPCMNTDRQTTQTDRRTTHLPQPMNGTSDDEPTETDRQTTQTTTHAWHFR